MYPSSLEAFCRGALDEPGMSGPAIALIIAGCVLVYGFIGGLTQKFSGDSLDASPTGFIWPLSLPWLLGSALASYVTRTRVPTAIVVERTLDAKEPQ